MCDYRFKSVASEAFRYETLGKFLRKELPVMVNYETALKESRYPLDKKGKFLLMCRILEDLVNCMKYYKWQKYSIVLKQWFSYVYYMSNTKTYFQIPDIPYADGPMEHHARALYTWVFGEEPTCSVVHEHPSIYCCALLDDGPRCFRDEAC